jgi:NTE family protein
MTERKRVGLALGGGALRGTAHVGVLRVLEREGIPVDCVAGTSAGSVVGAAYAAGLSPEKLLELGNALRWRDVARPAFSRYGLISFARLETYFVRILGDLTFSDLKRPFAAVAADLESSEQVVLRTGRVAPAVRASCSVPILVKPVELGGRLLVDGGVLNNLPISVARELGVDVVIAVNLGCPQGRRPRGLTEIILWTLETLLQRAGDDPATADVYIPVPVRGLRSLASRSTLSSSLALGEAAAEKALPAIRAALADQT